MQITNARQVDLNLNENDTITDIKSGTKLGNWSMMYDQGMILRMEDSHILYYANFRYEVRPEQDMSWISESNYSSFESKCGKTMIGIAVERDKMSFRCFTAE